MRNKKIIVLSICKAATLTFIQEILLETDINSYLYSKMKKSNKFPLFFQVKDICNELEVRSLCHKILQNVSMLLHADRGSLFLVQGERGGGCTPLPPGGKPRGRCLVSKLFDVCSRSTLKEMEKRDEIRIPWGTGIVGYVAESGEPVNIPDAYQVRNLFAP